MAVKVNDKGFEHAENLIKGHHYERDSDWSEAQPAPDDENDFLDENGWDAFSSWYLAYDSDENEETKGRYKFPFGDFAKLHRSALIAAKQRAGSEDYSAVEKAADALLQRLDG